MKTPVSPSRNFCTLGAGYLDADPRDGREKLALVNYSAGGLGAEKLALVNYSAGGLGALLLVDPLAR